MLDSAIVKRKAREYGVDLVGIGAISRFEGTPACHDPRAIAPAAASVIALGFRVLRGAFRGIESGTNFYQLTAMGAHGIDTRFAPAAMRRVANLVEDAGYEAVTLMAEKDRRPDDDKGTDPEMSQTFNVRSMPVAPGRPAPDVIIDPEQGAYLCGLGEIGMGGFFLTPEFGPFQRFAFILTDAELEPDLVASPTLCDHCGKCAKGCPGRAISSQEQRISNWDGVRVPSWTLDEWQCAAYHAGAASAGNPFIPPEAYAALPHGEEIARGERKLSPDEARAVRKMAAEHYWGFPNNYAACVCGKSCHRECYVHLEERGALRRSFVNRFRTDPPWRLDSTTTAASLA